MVLSHIEKDLCHILEPPLSQASPSPLLGLGACHHPSPVSPQSVTDPSLYSGHNTSPPVMRSSDVLPGRMLTHSPAKLGPLFYWLRR